MTNDFQGVELKKIIALATAVVSAEESSLVDLRYQLWHATLCGNPYARSAATTIT